jgi:hypothetical protein
MSEIFMFLGGVAVGAAFSPFWIKVWENLKTVVKSNLPPKE